MVNVLGEHAISSEISNNSFVENVRFSSDEEAIAAVDQYFVDFPESHFRNGIHLLENKWTKCIELLDNHVE